ncbi:MAG: polyprenyl synthetase family protein [Alphaproteobacteria bacterium]
MADLDTQMTEIGERVTQTLDALLPPVDGPRGRVVEAMRYSALSGGKRLRPFLVVSTARLYGVPDARSLRAAAALEMIHCYSLIHDDLPAMDDADLRRGKPSVHKQFDEATAILAGDGLLTYAFEVAIAPETHDDPAVTAALVRDLARAAGAEGMVGGQMIDLSGERDGLDLDGISELQRLKTGALIAYGCQAGCILGKSPDEDRIAFQSYTDNIGLAFQIADDILDATASEADLGKPAGQDEAMNKATFVKLLGLDGAREKAEALVTRACDALDRFDDRADALRDVARFIVTRKS